MICAVGIGLDGPVGAASQRQQIEFDRAAAAIDEPVFGNAGHRVALFQVDGVFRH